MWLPYRRKHLYERDNYIVKDNLDDSIWQDIFINVSTRYKIKRNLTWCLKSPRYVIRSSRYEKRAPRYVALLLSFLNKVTNRSLGLSPGNVLLPVMNNASAVWPLAQARTHQRCLISRAYNVQQRSVMIPVFCCTVSVRALVRKSYLFQVILCVNPTEIPRLNVGWFVRYISLMTLCTWRSHTDVKLIVWSRIYPSQWKWQLI